MTDSISMDDSELTALAADLAAAPALVKRDVRAVVSKGALNIKNQLRDEMRESPSFKGVGGAISYDLREAGGFGADVIEAEVGPTTEAGSPGNLANIAYFGTSRGGGATVPDPQGALDAEGPRFVAALEALIAKAL